MKRTSVFGAMTAAALLLVGCSSTGGTATAASSTSAVQSLGSSGASSTAAVSSPAGTTTATSSAAPTSSAAAGTDGQPTGAAGTDDSTTATTKTVGDTTGAIDAQTTVWFTAFCTGFAPVIDVTSSMSSLGADMANPATAQKKLVSLYSSLGSTFTKTAATLKGLPAPTFPGGATFASQTITAFESAGPAFTSQAKQIAAANVTSDPSSLSSAMIGLSDSMGKAVAPLEKLGTLKLTAQTQAALEKIPACAKIQSLAGG